MIRSKKRRKLSLKINCDANYNSLISIEQNDLVNSYSYSCCECQQENKIPETSGKYCIGINIYRTY